MMHRLTAAAIRRELQVTYCDVDEDHPHIWQLWIKNPRRALGTSMLVTCSRGTPTVTVCQLTSTEKVSWRRAFIWLDILAI